MIYVESPDRLSSTDPLPRVFLAGGITSCPDWQQSMLNCLGAAGFTGTVVNPRRANFPIHDPLAAPAQIKWEWEMLRDVDLVVFWFAKGSLNPIVLYELGAHRDRDIVVGCDPEYARTQDVVEQLKLQRPELTVHRTFDEFFAAAHARLEAISAAHARLRDAVRR